jgi:hypothetical protein
MLDDFVDELKQELLARRGADAASVISNGDPVTRGKVQAYDHALRVIDELQVRYLEPVEEPPAVRQMAEKERHGGRRFGTRRVA